MSVERKLLHHDRCVLFDEDIEIAAEAVPVIDPTTVPTWLTSAR